MDYNQNNQYGAYPQGYMPPQNQGNYNSYNPYSGNYDGSRQNMNGYYQPPVYNNMPYGNAPVYPYGIRNNQQNYEMVQQRFIRLREQKQEIKKYSSAIAGAMIAFLVISSIFGIVLELLNLTSLYDSNTTFASCIGVFYSFTSIGIPFMLAKRVMAGAKEDHTVSYYAPKFNLKTVSVILASVLGCLAAMCFTGIITYFFEEMGITFSSGKEPEINNVYDIIALFLGTAIVPPLVEEFAMRNVVMQPLRKYGNAFAVIMSAVVFGVFHGTPSQIPFAMICGLFIGYAVIATNSIWTGVIIHAIVNALSCAYYTFLYFTDEDTADSMYEAVCMVVAAAGLVGLIVYLIKFRDEVKSILSENGLAEYTLKEKVIKFIFTPAMIIAIIIFMIQAISLISFNSGVYA